CCRGCAEECRPRSCRAVWRRRSRRYEPPPAAPSRRRWHAATDKAARSYLDLAFEIGRRGPALEPCNRGGRIERLRAKLLAGLMWMASVTAPGARGGPQTVDI